MTINRYDKGSLVRVTGTFTTIAGAAVDPTVVKFDYYPPATTVTTLIYGTDGALVRDGPGIYHVDVSASATGLLNYRFYSTGTGQAAAEGKFQVNESVF